MRKNLIRQKTAQDRGKTPTPIWRLLEGLQLPPFVPASATPEQTRILFWGSSSPMGTEKRKAKKCRRGEKQQEGSCPYLRQGELLLRAPLTSGWGFPRDGAEGRYRTTEQPVHGGARGAGAGTGRKGGLVTRRNIINNFLSPSPGISLLPNVPVSAVRASPACTAATSPSRDRAARLGSARDRLRAKEGAGKDTRG